MTRTKSLHIYFGHQFAQSVDARVRRSHEKSHILFEMVRVRGRVRVGEWLHALDAKRLIADDSAGHLTKLSRGVCVGAYVDPITDKNCVDLKDLVAMSSAQTATS